MDFRWMILLIFTWFSYLNPDHKVDHLLLELDSISKNQSDTLVMNLLHNFRHQKFQLNSNTKFDTNPTVDDHENSAIWGLPVYKFE